MGRGGRETTEKVAVLLLGIPTPENLEDTLGDAGDSVKARATGREDPAGAKRDENTLPGEVHIRGEEALPSTVASAPSPP